MSEITAWAPTVVTIFVAIFTAGKVTERIKDHEKQIDEHDALLIHHGAHLGRIDVALVRLEGYQAGLSAAGGIAGTKKDC